MKEHARALRWSVGIGLLFIVATNLLFVRLYLQTPPGHQYTGIGFEAVADKLVYYSMIEQGEHGALFMRNVHTSEPQVGLLFSPHWYLIGMTASLFSLPIPVAYHLYRILFTIVFLLLLYSFTRQLFTTPLQHLGAFAVTLFSSGFGWIYFMAHPWINDPSVHWLQVFNSIPIDMYMTEFSVFTNTLQSPLFILSYILILAIWMLSLQQNVSKRNDLIMLALVVLLGSIHPYDLPLLIVVLGSYAIWDVFLHNNVRPLLRLWPVVIGVLITALYQWWSVASEPALSGWLSQNIAFSPSLKNYLWGMGAVAPLAVMGIMFLIRTREMRRSHWRLVTLWAVWMPILMYLPTAVNRRFANTLLVPFSMLAWYGMVHIARGIRPYLLRTAFFMMCAMLLVSGTMYQLAEESFYQLKLNEKYNYYLDPYIQKGLQVFRENVNYNDVLLPSDGFIGILFGAFTPVRLYVGHAHQTIQYELKKDQMEWFFAEPQGSLALERRKAFLMQNKITRIVLYKPSMKVSYDWLDAVPGLVRLYDSLVLRMYTVNP